jgi:hypothetical protein
VVHRWGPLPTPERRGPGRFWALLLSPCVVFGGAPGVGPSPRNPLPYLEVDSPMSKRTDIDLLIELPADDFDERIRSAAERMEMRTNRALVENRDLTQREVGLCEADKAELVACRRPKRSASTTPSTPLA